MSLFKLVETDNFGGDYPDEKELCQVDSKGRPRVLLFRRSHAELIQTALNHDVGPDTPRYWRVAPADYVLQGDFEP